MCENGLVRIAEPKIDRWIDKRTGIAKDLKDLTREELLEVIEYMTPGYLKGMGITSIYRKV